MRQAAGFFILILALAPLGLGLLWLVGAIGGGEWDLRVGDTVVDGVLVGFVLTAAGSIVAAAGLRLMLTPKRSVD
jgi:hypothetical protein